MRGLAMTWSFTAWGKLILGHMQWSRSVLIYARLITTTPKSIFLFVAARFVLVHRLGWLRMSLWPPVSPLGKVPSLALGALFSKTCPQEWSAMATHALQSRSDKCRHTMSNAFLTAAALAGPDAMYCRRLLP